MNKIKIMILKIIFEKIKKEENKIQKLKDNENKLSKFFNDQFFFIYKNKKIQKINYHSTRINEHFYKIDDKNDQLQSYSSKDSKTLKKIYDFDNILKIVVGKSENVRQKINQLIITPKQSYFFLSFILKKRSIDFHFVEEESAKNWFYGLYHYCEKSQRNFKICSCTKYILFRLKKKMIIKLKENGILINKKTFAKCLNQFLNTFNN